MCRTCHGADMYDCMSCYNLYFVLHWPGHRCIEKCGDGYNMGYYECDDANILAGDGCDSWCKVERGYKCSGGSNTTRDGC